MVKTLEVRKAITQFHAQAAGNWLTHDRSGIVERREVCIRQAQCLFEKAINWRTRVTKSDNDLGPEYW